MIRQWFEFARRPEIRSRVVFLSDYDALIAEQLVQGVDAWVNTPRRPWEASGLVDFHGANKPTGMDRTWPNVLTREAMRGHEFQITRYKRLSEPDHDVILPFTRYIAGPGDYTPTVFTTKELQGNTWGHELAQAIIFTSPFLCFGGHLEYLANPARDVLTAIRPVWTRPVF